MRSFVVCSAVFSLSLFAFTGCGGGDTGESLGKQFNLAVTEAFSELVKEKDPQKKKELRAKWEPKIDAIEEKAKKLAEAEKKKYDDATANLGGLWRK